MLRHVVTSLSLLVLCACANTGSVTETRPLSPLGGFKKLAVIVEAQDPSATNAHKNTEVCQRALKAKLVEAKMFEVLNDDANDSADLIMKVKLQQANDGFALMGNAGAAKVSFAADFTDPKANQSLGEIQVTGTSESNMQVKVGGMDTRAMEDTIRLACDNAGKHTSEFLQTKK